MRNIFFIFFLRLIDLPLRASTCTAVGRVVVGQVDRDSFGRLLGPLKEVLSRNMSLYRKYVVSDDMGEAAPQIGSKRGHDK